MKIIWQYIQYLKFSRGGCRKGDTEVGEVKWIVLRRKDSGGSGWSKQPGTGGGREGESVKYFMQ